MHRSGTSALAGVFHHLGASLGERLLPPQPDNPAGFWESRVVSQIHDELLDELGRSWHDARPLGLDLTDPAVERARTRLSEALWQEFDGAHLMAVKDPRLCRLLPLWRPVLGELPWRPGAVLVVRNPSDVAASLARRNGLSFAQSTLLWLRHLLEAELHTRDWPRALVRYEDLLNDWRSAAVRIADTLGFAWPHPPEAVAPDVEAFLRPDLQHHQGSWDALSTDERVSPWVREAVRGLQKATHSGDLEVLTDAFDDLRSRLADADSAFDALLVEPQAMERTLQQVRAELVESQGEVDSVRDELGVRSDEAASLREQLAVAREHVSARDTRLRDLEENLRAHRESLDARDGEGESLRRALAAREGEMASLRDNLVLAREHLDLRSRRLAELEARQEETRQTLHQRQSELARALGERDESRDALAHTQSEFESARQRFEAERSEVERQLDAARQQLTRLEHDHALAAENARGLERELGEMLASRSFRLTRPLRSFEHWRRRRRQRAAQNGSGVTWRALRGVFQTLPVSPATRYRLKTKLYKRAGFLFARTESYRTWRAFESARRSRGAVRTAPVEFASSGDDEKRAPRTPTVSVVVPVYEHLDLTLACLDSIAVAGSAVPYEVIVVDDASDPATGEALSARPDVRYVRNPENLGFVRTCNRGADEARGEFIVLLNNDTLVRPGWLDALIGTFADHPGVGLVGAQLVYPDGRLQEAGGILWRDGSAWNYGRGGDPHAPAHAYARDVDYCSGACIALPLRIFRGLGGFDEWFAPAYGEDSDLALRVRALGLRTLYQPLAVVEHIEGATSGTDPDQGIKAHQKTNARKLFERWEPVFERFAPPGVEPEREKDRDAVARVLFIDACTPTPDQDAGSLTALRLMQAFQSVGYKVTFVPEDNFLYLDDYTADLQRLGIECLYAPYERSVEELLHRRGGEFDVVVVFRHAVAAKHLTTIRQLAPQARVVFHTSDLHFIREQREAALRGHEAVDWHETRERELDVMRRSDCTIVHSATERDWLLELMPHAFVYVFPWILDVTGCRAPFEARSGLVFLGGYGHPPNVDGALYFAREILPRVRERLPDVEFRIVGANPTPELRALDLPGVEVTGYLPDLGEALDRCRLCVAPLRYGAGIKGKLAMTMSYGVPSVASTIAVEGMELEDGTHVVVADDPDRFADEVVSLYHDRARWSRISDAGMRFLEEHYSTERGRQRVAEILQALGAPPFRGRCNVCGDESGFGPSESFDLARDVPCQGCGATAAERSLAAGLSWMADEPAGRDLAALARRRQPPAILDATPRGRLARALGASGADRVFPPAGAGDPAPRLDAVAALVDDGEALDPADLARWRAQLAPGGWLLLDLPYAADQERPGGGRAGRDVFQRLREAGFAPSLASAPLPEAGIARRQLFIGRAEAAAERPGAVDPGDRDARLAREIEVYREVEDVHDLPEIFHYWSQRHLRPILEACSIPDVDGFFVDALARACERAGTRSARIVSLGSGNCDFEAGLAEQLVARGVRNFRVECLELNPHMLERGRQRLAGTELAPLFRLVEGDVARWDPRCDVDGGVDVFVANQSLHHFSELEALFERVRGALRDDGVFAISDIIGRNGHMRWPEALARLDEIWASMPDRYKLNHALQRFEASYENWDCSTESNEGIRAQDILPLLVERFGFETFVAWGNLIDVFVDRGFGHNFDVNRAEDRSFIDEVAELDERLIDEGVLTPTHMLALLRTEPVEKTRVYRNRTPERSVRPPD
ncbi:MAG: glycosyltransferase [Myxococcota bacterium]